MRPLYPTASRDLRSFELACEAEILAWLNDVYFFASNLWSAVTDSSTVLLEVDVRVEPAIGGRSVDAGKGRTGRAACVS